MDCNNIKFRFDTPILDIKKINQVLEEIINFIRINIDENFNSYSQNETNIIFKDLSHLNEKSIENEIKSFFELSLTESSDEYSYKFLVLKTSEKSIILGNIDSLIFNFTSIDYLNNIFNKLGDYEIKNYKISNKKEFKPKNNIHKANHDFKNQYPLSKSQLNIYLDEKVKNIGTSYNIPFQIKFSKLHSNDEIQKAIYKLVEIYPVLSSRVLVKDNEVLFSFDGEPQINIGSLDDIDSFVEPFKLGESLSKFLIIENEPILCIDCHHLICDGTSKIILINKLMEILEGSDIDSVDDGVLRQLNFEENLSSIDLDEAEKFYDTMLCDIDEVYDLMPSVAENKTNSEFSSLLNLDAKYLKSFLDNHDITDSQFFTSVFAYTLSRFAGSSKVFFNIMVNGRGHVDLSDSMGMFVRTLPLLINCENRNVNSFLKDSSNLIKSAMKYDFYPYSTLANKYDFSSDILFRYEYNLIYESDKRQEEIIVEDLKHDEVGDLSFYVFNYENYFKIKAIYSDKYSKDLIEHFVESFKLISQEIINNNSLSTINYTLPSDIISLDEYNNTQKELKYNDILEAFNDNLNKYPNNTLVIDDDMQYNYAESAYFINSIKRLLKQHCICENEIVTVFVDRNHWVLFSSLSCLSLGITYVPIDENYPDKRIAFMILQSNSKAIITTNTFKSRVKNIIKEYKLKLDIINISSLENNKYLDSVENNVDYVTCSENDVACILYTSGTTGTPKAVQMTKMGILNLIESYVNSTSFTSQDVQAIFASVGFDVSLEQFASIFTGGAVTYVPNDIRLDINKLNNYFIKHNVTHTLITTQIAKLFVNTISKTSLKVLQTAGEKLGSINTPKDYILSDVYGPTEANYITSIDVDKKIDESSVGFSNWNVKTYILDQEQRRVPYGAIGELYISGYQTTKGYLDNPEANEKSLFKNPFDGDIPGYEVMYATGDLCRYLPDGSIGIVGRIDSQVKIRGNRVELSEIEFTIRDMKHIEDVTVQTVKHDGNHELVAYAVLDNDFDGNIKEYIQSYIRERKPEYMIPAFVIQLDEIPVNVNGKVDKRALPEVDFNSLRVEYIAPRNENEKIIVDAFEKVFNIEKISILDDFTVLGGDSLTAIKLLSHIKSYNISTADILSLKTPKAIGKLIKDDDLDFNIYSLENGCPLSESQLNVYLDILSNDKKDSYIIPISMNISKDYSKQDLVNALNTMFKVHPILEMCVDDSYDVPYMSKGSKPEIIIEPDDISESYINDFISKAFDLNDVLCRFLILEDESFVNNGEYVLFAVFHHIIFDALSGNAFKQDLKSILEGKDLKIDDSFLKVVALNQEMLKTKGNEAELFYDKMLAESENAGILLNCIKNDGPGICSSELNADINSILSKYKINENILFTSTFAYALSRFAGNDKVLFNIIENGRSRFNNYDSIGMFVNTLPVLIDCKNQDFESFIKYVSEVVYAVRKYDYYPFRLIANEYDVDSSILFQYVPEWVDIKEGDESIYDNLFEDKIQDMDDMIGDFLVNVIQNGDGYKINIIYSEKYSKDFVERFICSYNLILQQIVNVDYLNEIDYISDEDIKLLDEYNKTEHDLTYDDILDAFNDNLRKYPNNNFVTMDDRLYTYGESAFIANKISQKLMDLGVESQDCVAFLTERSEYYMFAVLGIMSMGGIYVPLDDAHPDERIKFILNDTQSKVIIVSDETYERVNKINYNAIIFNINDIFEDNGTLSHIPVVYGDLACILYTSGTTGVPKGVKITRKSMVNLATFYQDKYCIGNEDVYGMFSTIGFDAAMLAMIVVLYSGSCLSIIPNEIRLDMKKLNEYFTNQNVTHTLITSQVGKLFMQAVDETSLNVLLVGGEKLGEFQSPEDYVLVDAFGPTEACVFISSIRNEDKIDPSSIGSLGYNTKSYVLDNEFRRVPLGAVGELCIAGYQVADGYLNREDENIKSFIDNSFVSKVNDDYTVMYRTGDMVRILPDGTLGIVGRRDSQVKIRGNRVELSEIESTIQEIDYIKEVTVQTIKNGTNNELVVYVVINEKDDRIEENIKDEICKYVDNNKPDYMIPSYVVVLDKIPLNVNSKVDKKALPEIDFKKLHKEFVEAETKDEIAVVEAFQKVFNSDKISVLDDFILLGGDSLLAIRLIAYLKDYNISVADILSLRTPREIANSIKKETFNLDIYSLEDGCPLNEPQLNVYLDSVVNNMYNTYIIPIEISISKKCSIDDVFNALHEMIDTHPILKMCVSDDYEVPHLIKGANPSIIFKSDFSKSIKEEFLLMPLNLHETLCKFLIFENDKTYSLFAVFHHIIFDGLSAKVFLDDLTSILNGESIVYDDSFLKVSAFNQQIQKSDEFNEAEKFYDIMLADLDDVDFLLDSISSEGSGNYSTNLNVDIDEFLNRNDINENTLFTSAFAYTLSRYVGYDKVLFNIIENGRGRFNNLNSIGMYVNTLPIFVDCKNDSISSFMNKISDLIYGTLKYNFYPFRLLANKYEIDSNILFQYIPQWFKSDEINSDVSDHIDVEGEVIGDIGEIITDFSVNVIEDEPGYILDISYSDKFSRDFIEHFALSYELILREMIKVDKLSDIIYTSKEDLEFLDKYNQTECPLKYSDILDAFNEHLSKNPDNLLVNYKDVNYSYSEGAFIANKLAKQLTNLGISTQDCVAFLVERSEAYLLIILAILSMGGVYVPLDDALPDERLEFMIKDTKSKVLIVSNETYERAQDLIKNDDGGVVLLNISDIMNEDIGSLSSLTVVYGDLACILYTSGTTGIPKGVKITRRSIINLATFYSDEYGLGSDDVYGLFSTIGFDAGSQAVCQTFYAGACLSIVPDDIKLNVHALNDYFVEHGVTHTMITTQVGKLFVENVEDTSIEVLTVGGEKLGEFESPDDYLLIDGFGPTETFAFISSINIADKIDSSSIGYVNYNTKFYVLDDEFRRVPVGAVGELYVSGYQVACGYLNREEENIKAFIDNPFGNGKDYGKLYRTGDMVRFLPDGTLGIVGRRDSQVKIRGNRVELSEVEAVIRELDYVEDVTVQTIKNGTNNELVAYVVSTDDLNDDFLRDIIQEYVIGIKPEYMVPSFVVRLDNIPLNVNGKVDNRALPKIDLNDLQREYVAPRNEIEKIISNAFEEVFKQEKISLFDDFTMLGGDSIMAIRIISALHKKDIKCTVKDLMIYKTPYLISSNINKDYGFYLVKKGKINQNMFIIPPQGGLSIILSILVDNIDFKGNIYLIDDFKYELSLEEIGKTDSNLTFEKYYEAIEDIFEDGDVIVGYSLGCIYASLIVEKLEKSKLIDKCILIDGPLNFVNYEKPLKDEIIEEIESDFKNDAYNMDKLKEDYTEEFVEKMIEICLVNAQWDFHTPKIKSHITYISTSKDLRSQLDKISCNNEYIIIDSTHKKIISEDVGKITKYIK